MADSAIADETCRAFDDIPGPGPGPLLRFIVGEDLTPREMTSEDIASELGDPFATLLLLKGNFPTNADDLLAAMDAATSEGDPLRSQMSFVLGEVSQLPVGPGGVDPTTFGMRFLVTRGSANHGPDVIISASDPMQGLVELMAWDQTHLGFNFYRTLRGAGGWVWAGNSRHALSTPTKGKGPFESHPSGSLLMKELKLPWVHWHSFKVHILENAFPQGDIRRTHRWFTEKKGAETCETAVVMPSIERWIAAHLDLSIAANGQMQDPARLVGHVVTSPTVNLASSSTESAAASLGTTIDLPPGFFVDVDALAAVGLPGPPPFAVPGDVYTSSLERFDFVITDGAFTQTGDTHFAFVVPERAFEDNEALRQSIARNLISKRLAAALLMVDFPNPVFSARRASLLKHAPATASMVGDVSSLSEDMANNILAASDSSAPGSPEREFAESWNVGDPAWLSAFGAELGKYYEAIQQQLQGQAGFNDYVRLAESRRNRVRDMPIFESRFLFPETNIPKTELSMRPDAIVTESTSEDI